MKIKRDKKLYMNDFLDFVDFCKKQRIGFNTSIHIRKSDCFASELRDLLSIINGENMKGDGLFRYTFSGHFLYYKFLDWSEIKRITAEINSNPVFRENISKDLYHFAIRKTGDNYYEYSNSFAIDSKNVIYKCNFIEHDRFNLVRDIGQTKVSNSLRDFLTIQKQLISLDLQTNYKIK